MIKAVVFDMDGLIVETESVESRALEKVLKEYGKKPMPHPNGLIHVVGYAGQKSWDDFISKYNLPDSVEVIRAKKRQFFNEIIEAELAPMPGFMKLINELESHKLAIALASNRHEGTLHRMLEILKAKHFFQLIVGPSEKRRHKPHPDIYLYTAAELGVKPDECVVLEDSEPGVVSGKAAGMKVIAVPNKFTEKQDLSKADIIVESLDKVNAKLIGSL
jgi:HAD superfamily hydrolase (TIGR01509 family)